MDPSHFPDRFTRIKVMACPPVARAAACTWLPGHCHTNSHCLVAHLRNMRIEASPVCGLARLPYSRRVNDPERWRAHVWVAIDGAFIDPTYELAWHDCGHSTHDVIYYVDIEATRRYSHVASDGIIRSLEEHAVSLQIPMARFGNQDHPPDVEIIFDEVSSAASNTSMWFDIREALLSPTHLWRVSILTFTWDSSPIDIPSPQFQIFKLGANRFILQNVSTLDSVTILSTSSITSGPVGFSTRYTRNIDPGTHVVSENEMITALENVFRQRPSTRRWHVGEYL